VVCKEEEKMTVVGQILLIVNKLALDKLRTKYEGCTLSMLEVARLEEEHYTRDAILSTRDFSTFTIRFGVGDKYQRQAFVLTTCECDLEFLENYTYGTGAVLFSVGCWGSSKSIVNTIASAMYEQYDVYVDYNDCDDVYYAKYKGETQ
jgi:hypothetical protein